MRSSKIGGQAVMEGIMMRNQDKYSIAVRKPNQEIELKVEDYKGILGKYKIMKLPLLRGVASFVDSMVVGTQCIMYSANFFEEEEEEETEELTQEEIKAREAKEERENKWLMYGTVVLSIVLSVGLFMVLPYYIAAIFRHFTSSETILLVVEALVRVLLFMLYLVLISKMKDIQRVFMYHGAEHKCINCVERGLELNVENVMKSSRLHKRCGTSFLFIVIFVSIVVLLFIQVPQHWLRVVLRIALMPLIAGISYEFISWAGRSEGKLALLLSKPGMALQKLTTREPEPDMAEVAIAAVEAVFDWKAFLKEEEDQERAEAKAS